MTLQEKVHAVEQVFEDLNKEMESFQGWASIHCLTGCGKCCFKPDIEATPLEFLPFALHLYQNNLAEVWHERLQANTSSICLLLNPQFTGAGFCSSYNFRPLICRLFGFSARTNKYGKPELVTCQVIKTDQPQGVNDVGTGIEQGKPIPVMNQFYMQLHSIDFELTREFFPINEAMKRAIEVILHYYAYRS